MTQPDPRALIEAATPLPWQWERHDWNGTDTLVIRAPEVHEHQWEERYGRIILRYSKRYNEGDKSALARSTDLDLLIYAVNNLPALLDVAEALERLANQAYHYGEPIKHMSCRASYQPNGKCSCGIEPLVTEAREALDRLKESR